MRLPSREMEYGPAEPAGTETRWGEDVAFPVQVAGGVPVAGNEVVLIRHEPDPAAVVAQRHRLVVEAIRHKRAARLPELP